MGIDSNNSKSDSVSGSDKVTSNPLSRKINKILETRLENDKGAVEALKELSNFFPENSLRARRNLRGQIERRTVTINEDFVLALKEVTDAVDAIYVDVKDINSTCSEMKTKLQVARAETKHLTEQTARLHKQREQLKMQLQVSTAFSENFLLTAEEITCLKSSNGTTPNIGPNFFSALDKTQTIRNNTKHLLQTGQQTTALDVMSQCSEVREGAITGVYQWLLQQARHPDTISSHVPKAMSYMEDRPQLFKLVVEEWVVVRRGALHRQLLHSLTHLSPTHSPIELGAHSPTRYVGDMLAWLHQALAGERELMGSLFGGCTEININEQTCKSVASISESVCRPLKTRIEQMIVSGEHTKPTPASDVNKQSSGQVKPVMLYKMSGLLQFYRNTILQLTSPCVLVSTLEELQQLSHKMFLSSLSAQVSVGCERLPPPPSSLTPSTPLSSLLALLSDVITASTLVTEEGTDHAAQVVDMVVGPLLVALVTSCGGVAAVEAGVYLLNCYHQIHSTISMLHTTNSSIKLKEIEALMSEKMTQLANEQFTALTHSLGLDQMLPHITAPVSANIASLPQCSPAVVHNFVNKLEHFLSSPDSFLLPPLSLLISSSHRQKTLLQASSSLLVHYTSLYTAVNNPAGRYNNPTSLIPKHPDVIKGLMIF